MSSEATDSRRGLPHGSGLFTAYSSDGKKCWGVEGTIQDAVRFGGEKGFNGGRVTKVGSDKTEAEID